MTDELVTLSAIAKYFRVSTETIDRWSDQNLIPFTVNRRGYRYYNIPEVLEHIEKMWNRKGVE